MGNPFDKIAGDVSRGFAKWEMLAYLIGVLLIFGLMFLIITAKSNPEDIGFFETYNLRDNKTSTNETVTNETNINETRQTDDLNRQEADRTGQT